MPRGAAAARGASSRRDVRARWGGLGPTRAFESIEGRHLDQRHPAVEEDPRAERLVLGRGRHPRAHGEVVENA